MNLDERVRCLQPPPSLYQQIPDCGISTVRLQQISVGLEKAQGLQEGVRGAESPVFQPRILLSLAKHPPRLPFPAPQRLGAALSPPLSGC